MLFSLLGYVLLGLLLAWPLRYLLRRLPRWRGPRSGLTSLQWKHLRPYLPPAQRSAAATRQGDAPAASNANANASKGATE